MKLSFNRLYGLPDAEIMYDPIQAVWEHELEPDALFLDRVWEIEEWSTFDPAEHLPSPLGVLDYIVESAADDQGLEGSYDAWLAAAEKTNLEAALDHILGQLASHVNVRCADRLLATHTLKVIDGEPYVDGEPLYRKAMS